MTRNVSHDTVSKIESLVRDEAPQEQLARELECWSIEGYSVLRDDEGKPLDAGFLESGVGPMWYCQTCGRVGAVGGEAFSHERCQLPDPIPVEPVVLGALGSVDAVEELHLGCSWWRPSVLLSACALAILAGAGVGALLAM